MTARPRPTALTAAYWCLLGAAVLMIAGGLLTALVSYSMVREQVPASVSDESIRQSLVFYRGSGGLVAVVGAVLATLMGRVRSGDARSRRAAMVLGMVIVLVLSAARGLALAPVSILTMLAVLPVIVGVLLLSRPVVAEWFAGVPPMDAPTALQDDTDV